MSLNREYLNKKLVTSHRLLQRLDNILNDTDLRHGSLSKHVGSIKEMRDNTDVKSRVINALGRLVETDIESITERKFKAINQTLFYCVNKPELPNNKLFTHLYKANFNEEQREGVAILLDLVKEKGTKEDKIKIAKKIMSQFVRERSSRLNSSSLKNLVLAGGGAKGFSLAKIPKALDSAGVNGLKRIAGTSAGAILGSMMAVGYTSDELEEIVLTNQFGLFTKNSRLSINAMNEMSDGVKLKPLKPFSDNAYAADFHRNLITELFLSSAKKGLLPEPISKPVVSYYNRKMSEDTEDSISKRRLNVLSKIYDNLITPLSSDSGKRLDLEGIFINGLDDKSKEAAVSLATRMTELQRPVGERYFQQLYPTVDQSIKFSLRDSNNEDLIVGFFGDLIEAKLRKLPESILNKVFGTSTPSSSEFRNLNFEQLKRLHDIRPDEFKEFYCTIAVKLPVKEQISSFLMADYHRYKHYDVSHKHPELSKMAIADAVRVSMNLPGIFNSYKFNVNGKEYSGADGGVISNLSIQVFDDQYEPEETMCVIYADEKKMRSADNIYQLLIHPRKKDEIEREIELVKAVIKHDVDRRQELQYVVKKETKGNIIAEQLRSESLAELKKVDIRINNLRFRTQVLENELSNSKNRSLLPVSIEDSLARKRHRGQYLPQDLNRTVLINTGDVGTLDFKLSFEKKTELMKRGELAVANVLSGRDDLDLNFLARKCEQYEYTFALDKIERMARHIKDNQNVDQGYMSSISSLFNKIIPRILDKDMRNDVVDKINDVLHKERRTTNKALRVARGAWRDCVMYYHNEGPDENLSV
ncbi:patatin-like phospholipase family protein [Pseudoalteromonas sp. OFAV1]|uniref:patatin-like phospholipase family protein n=1 Tax=Pseudoalteromonas sp. OFAV1 TaxID=2908892 RepID=UPI001F492CF0|nr:patatin-like phospholipase family protein [Pseudoalteromonas sp. OFAV1]MCF2903001.1 patatin-like phospholipase family protein [Pseudoalteromonas sp. OFAV1]